MGVENSTNHKGNGVDHEPNKDFSLTCLDKNMNEVSWRADYSEKMPPKTRAYTLSVDEAQRIAYFRIDGMGRVLIVKVTIGEYQKAYLISDQRKSLIVVPPRFLQPHTQIKLEFYQRVEHRNQTHSKQKETDELTTAVELGTSESIGVGEDLFETRIFTITG